jgi:hypothetical protein
MRTMLWGKATLLFMTLGLLLAIPAVALADNVVNDVVAGGNDTITAGGSTTINYRIVQQPVGADGQAGCNAADTSPATVTINAPAAVTATPGSLIFTACQSGSTSNSQAVVFSSNTSGDYPITVSVSDSGTGSYNTNSAAFTLQVNAPPNTAPTKPGTPSGTTPNQGAFTLNWGASTDDGNPDPPKAVTYRLEHKDNNDMAYSLVSGAGSLSTNSYSFTNASPTPQARSWSTGPLQAHPWLPPPRGALSSMAGSRIR